MPGQLLSRDSSTWDFGWTDAGVSWVSHVYSCFGSYLSWFLIPDPINGDKIHHNVHRGCMSQLGWQSLVVVGSMHRIDLFQSSRFSKTVTPSGPTERDCVTSFHWQAQTWRCHQVYRSGSPGGGWFQIVLNLTRDSLEWYQLESVHGHGHVTGSLVVFGKQPSTLNES